MQEFPQSPGNMTEASQHLYELVRGRNLITYPDADILCSNQPTPVCR